MSTYSSPTDVVAGSLARSASLNAVDGATATAFALLPTNAQIDTGTSQFAVDTGSANAYLVATPQTETAYTDGMLIVMRPINTNTGASTINIDSIGAKDIKTSAGAALVAGDIVVGIPSSMRYSSVSGDFHLIGAPGLVPVTLGGTGVTSLADGGLMIGNGTSAIEVVAGGTTTKMLVGGGASTKPVWTTATGTGAPVRATSPTLTGLTLAGTLVMGEQDILVNAVLATDHTWTGPTQSITAGENLAQFELAYLKSDGKYWRTDADADTTTFGKIVMATASISEDASGIVLLPSSLSYIRDDSTTKWTVTNIGEVMYPSTAIGEITNDVSGYANPDIVRVSGYMETAVIFNFDAGKTWVEVP